MAPFNVESCIKVEILEWILQDWTTCCCAIESIHLFTSKHDELKKFLDDNRYEDAPATPNPNKLETPNIHSQHEELPSTETGESNYEKSPGKLNQSQECEQMKKLPIELWHLILANLSKKDLRNLRSTAKWLEEKISSIFFMSNVIPFSKNFYSTEGDRQREARSTSSDKLIATSDEEISTYVKHGRKFKQLAFSFDFDEKSLGLPLVLIFSHNLNPHSTYFSPVTNWLSNLSFKFAYLSELDRLAQDRAKMKAAIRQLDYINEFGLGLRSGFGWLHGADISDRAKLFEAPSPILSEGLYRVRPRRYQRSFAHLLATSTPIELLATPNPNENTRSLEDLCASLALKMFKQYVRILYRIAAPIDYLAIVSGYMRDHPLASAAPSSPNFGEAPHYLSKNSVVDATSAMSRLRQIEVGNRASLHERVLETESEDAAKESFDRVEFWSSVNSVRKKDFVLTQRGSISAYRSAILQERPPTYSVRAHPCIFNGCDLRIGNGALSKCVYETYAPSDLTEYQKSLIIEHADVQQTFLTSIILSIVDCSERFANVLKLNLVSISSRYLHDLNRCDFWDALPNLKETRLIVSPEWRNFRAEISGSISEVSSFPSTASYMMRELITDQISKKALKKLQLGFTDGGEHATGMFARNNFVMPAPICTENKDFLESISLGLELDELSLVNCWATAKAIVNFVRNPANKISSLKLESFSLLIFGGQYGRLSHTQELHSQFGIAHASNWNQLGHGVPCMTEAETAQFDLGFWRLLDDMSVVPQNVREALSYQGVLQNSWIEVIDKIGPGLNMEDTIKLLDNEEIITRETRLTSLVLDSCGYVVLKQQTPYDHFQANPEYDPFMKYYSAQFRTRAAALTQSIMSTVDIFCGRIVETWVQPEKYLLRNIFDLHTQWQGQKAETASFNFEDGRPRGGTARYTGIIEPFRSKIHHFLSNQS